MGTFAHKKERTDGRTALRVIVHGCVAASLRPYEGLLATCQRVVLQPIFLVARHESFVGKPIKTLPAWVVVARSITRTGTCSPADIGPPTVHTFGGRKAATSAMVPPRNHK